MAANWRVAIIDAATATEAALTAGLVTQLSATLSASDVEKKLKSNSMLGKRIKLAGTLKMPLPAGIQEDLVDPRNAAMLLLGHASSRSERWGRGRPTNRSKASRFAAAEYRVRPSPELSGVSRRPGGGGGRPRGRRNASGSG
jgi:hypothetical protein